MKQSLRRASSVALPLMAAGCTRASGVADTGPSSSRPHIVDAGPSTGRAHDAGLDAGAISSLATPASGDIANAGVLPATGALDAAVAAPM